MITPEEYELLLSGQVRQAIAAARGRDPLKVALDPTVPHARLVATQVKYLARAASKLPSYAAAQCILPPLAFEQASSEACAAHKRIVGDTVLDLTCGLGVDALFLSRRFRRVVTLERSEMLARIAAENFRRLEAANIEVVNISAEEYLQRPGLQFDWIFADPDRRSADGHKQVRLEACSPDIPALMPLIERASGRLCIKNSPLFDVDEALRLFPDSRVEVVSLGGECKEVLIYADGEGPSLTATALGRGSFTAAPQERAGSGERVGSSERARSGTARLSGEKMPPEKRTIPGENAGPGERPGASAAKLSGEKMRHEKRTTSEENARPGERPGASAAKLSGEKMPPEKRAQPGQTVSSGQTTLSDKSAYPDNTALPPAPETFDPARYRWLVVPDVALQKARLARLHLAGKADIWSENGYGFAENEPQDVIGKVFAVERIEPYDPRRLRRELRGLGVEVMKRDFPYGAEELVRRLGLRAGDDVRLAFTKIGNGFWAVRLK